MQYKNRFEKYSINEILPLVGSIERLPNRTRLNSLRLVVFKKSQTCSSCGIKATYFRREAIGDENPHLNMYGLNKYGHEVLFTKDHIIPKSKGGSNSLKNLQTMCVNCNKEKGNNVT